MIAAEDLMIGNYVMLNTDYTLPDWHQITAKDICDIAKNNLPKGVSIEPIPLTPDVLERLGFENGYFKTGFYGFTSLQWNKKDKCVALYYDNFSCFCKVNYLHQLQNLYKALTGKNLKFKTT